MAVKRLARWHTVGIFKVSILLSELWSSASRVWYILPKPTLINILSFSKTPGQGPFFPLVHIREADSWILNNDEFGFSSGVFGEF